MTEKSPRLIKKYLNRRLYDTTQSAYITLAEVKKFVLDRTEFQVVDAKTNEDLTRTILLQIILEEESGHTPMFSNPMLAEMIRFYGNAMQGVMGGLIENNIQAFLDIQQKLSQQTQGLWGAQKAPMDIWRQFLSMQSPSMPGMLGQYLEQSANVFVQMQKQLQKQTQDVLQSFGASAHPFKKPE